VVAATLGMLSLTGVAAAAPTVHNGPQAATADGYTLANVNSGKCLDVQDGATNDFGPVDQYTCYGGPVERWLFTYVGSSGGDNVYTLRNVNSGKCLDVQNGGTQDFATVDQYTCYGGPVQQWRYTVLSNGSATLTNVNSGKCLDVENGQKHDFAVVDQYSCYGGPVQQWTLGQ
jgi:hypothetical protein